MTQFRLGYPSRDRCSRLDDALRECRTAVEENDCEAWAVARLRARSLGARRALLAYRGKRVLDTVPGSGFVYVVSRREEKGWLHVDVTRLSLERAVARVNASLGNHPVGVRAFWWVTDIQSATAVVEGLIGELPNAEGGGYETDFNAVRARLNLALGAEGIVMDPFASLVRTRRR